MTLEQKLNRYSKIKAAKKEIDKQKREKLNQRRNDLFERKLLEDML